MTRLLLKWSEGDQEALEELMPPAVERELTVTALDDALSRLTALDPRQARLVEVRKLRRLT